MAKTGVQFVGHELFGEAEPGGVNLGKKFGPDNDVTGLNVFVLWDDCPHHSEEKVSIDDRDFPDQVRCFCTFITQEEPYDKRPRHYVCPFYPLCYSEKR